MHLIWLILNWDAVHAMYYIKLEKVKNNALMNNDQHYHVMCIGNKWLQKSSFISIISSPLIMTYRKLPHYSFEILTSEALLKDALPDSQ